jgi:2-keto-3-deoxy-L-rhamnonate aldolase RhmA
MKRKASEVNLKTRLARNELTIGSWVTLAHPLIPEILAPAGFDWLVVDMEHSSIGLTELLPLLISIEANGMVPLVRVGENNPNLIKRVMDAGAHGVIVANVCDRREAEQAIAAVKYPPMGSRGVGLYRAQGYGRRFEEYQQWLAEESIVIVQIEHIAAVKNLDEIFTNPALDAFMVGPYDLSGSLGKPGEFDDPQVVRALEEIMAAANRHKLTAGFHSVCSSPAEAVKRINQGYRFLAFSLDSIFLGDAAAEAMSALKKLLPGEVML